MIVEYAQVAAVERNPRHPAGAPVRAGAGRAVPGMSGAFGASGVPTAYGHLGPAVTGRPA
ncbi:hypothetical protein [Streptosporangium longisporum]|uniref:Uncharacterized protein n=1 Tax=Streptosporangium longisporum TaxID=46187 RepID=A0ABP6LJM2_9ACTN